MKTRSLELIVGLFVLTGLIVLAVLSIFLGRAVTVGRGRYEVSAIFTNVRGMAAGTPVRHLGINVGELEETEFTATPDKVRLVLSIAADHDIPADAQLTVRPSGILGDYYLEFAGGTLEAGFLPRDGSAVVQGEPMVTFEDMATQLAEFAGKLGNNMDIFAKNLDEISGSLNKILGDEEFQKNVRAAAAEAPQAIKSFNGMAERMTQLSDETRDLVKRAREVADRLDVQVARQGENLDKLAGDLDAQIARQGANLDRLTEKLVADLDGVNATLASLSEILTQIKEGKGTIGSLVVKDDLQKNLVKAVDQAYETLVEIRDMAHSVRRRWGK